MSIRGRPWGPLLFDSAIAVGLLVVALTTSHATGPALEEFRREPDALHVAFIVLMTVPLALRRLYPTAVILVVLLAWGSDRAFDYH